MWTCPKCGRTFKKQNQGHYCGKAPETIDAYIEAQPEEVQQYLKEIRNAIHAALPEAEERISYIGFHDRGMLLAGGCGDTNGRPGIDKTDHLAEAYEFGKNLY